MDIFLELLILLLIARAFGEVAERLGLPASVGEILAGVVLVTAAAQLGPAVPLLTQVTDSPALGYAAQFGIFFLVLLAGIEMEPARFVQRSRSAFFIALGGLLLPLLAGFLLAWLLLPAGELRSARAFTVGVVLSITAVPATISPGIPM